MVSFPRIFRNKRRARRKERAAPGRSEGICGTRTVAFLDILGFKSRLESQGVRELAKLYEAAVSHAAALNRIRVEAGSDPMIHLQGVAPSCQIRIMSDSIVLIPFEDSADAAFKLIQFVRLLFLVMLSLKLPLRGGIATGELYYNNDTSIIVGPALTRAYALEAAQDWVGVAIDPSVWERFPGSLRTPANSLFAAMLPEYPVPMKNSEIRNLRVINWRLNVVAQCEIIHLLQQAGVEKVKSKYQNTLSFLRWAEADGKIYIHTQDGQPSECPVIWLGDGEFMLNARPLFGRDL